MKYPLLLSLALLVSCKGLGHAPDRLVELYDRASPTGIIEIEIDRDGTIREMEAEIPVDDLPERVRSVALAELPGAEITGAEREIQAAGDAWEVKLTHEGRGMELVIDAAGDILETEKELRTDEVPQAVLDGADRAFGEGTRLSVEVIEGVRDGTRFVKEYHVKKRHQEATYKIVLDGDGNAMRVVREARAEIEIPLAR